MAAPASSDIPVYDLDLSSVEGHAKTVERIRSSTLDGTLQSSSFVRLNVKLPQDENKQQQSVTLFMATNNQYIAGMLGGEGKPYYFRDETAGSPPAELTAFLRRAGLLGRDEVPLDSKLGVTHNELGTLSHTFTLFDLIGTGRLNDFGASEKMRTAEDLKKPVSLLVCMIAESSRFREMELEFRKLYSPAYIDVGDDSVNVPNTARADEAIKNFDKSLRVTKWADEHVDHLDRYYRVEILEKRAGEMAHLIDHLQQADGPSSNHQAVLDQIVRGTYPKNRTGSASAERVHAIAASLKIKTGERLGEILSMWKTSRIAFRAAKSGVCTALQPRP